MKSNIVRLAARSALWCVMLAALFAFASPVFAQTTGRLTGTVEDAQAAVLPGVTVTVTSPQLQGANTTITDASGQFRFPSLPPGTYHVKAELTGFQPAEQSDVSIGIDQTINLGLKMQVAGLAETIHVLGTSPVLDTTSSVGGIHVRPEMFEALAVRRDIYAMTRFAPGVTQDTYGPSFYGSTSAENSYIIEGLNTTGINAGTEGKTLNSDFIQEVQVQTGGLNAEYGRLTGGNLNVLTKSGGNAFHGDLFGFGEGGGLQAANATASKRPTTTTTTVNTSHLADYGGDLGGFIVKDKVWFFGAYDRVDQQDNATVIRTLTSPGSPALGSTVPADIKRDLFAAKLTFKATQKHTFTATLMGDPTTRDGAIFTTNNGQNFTINGPASTWQGSLDSGGIDSVGRYEGVFGSGTLLNAMVGQHREKTTYGGAGSNTAQVIDQTVNPAAASGGFAGFDNQKFTRNVVGANFTKYAGDHSIKAGGDFEKVNTTVDRFQGGAGQRIYVLPNAAIPGGVYFRHRYYVNDRTSGFSRSNPATWSIALPLQATPYTKNASFYAQDAYKVVSNLSINYGVRWEQQNVLNRDHESVFNLKKNWAPRLGVVWDPTNTSKAKVYANFGRFYENIPQDINIRAFGGEVTAFSYNLSRDAANFLPNDAALRRSTLLGGAEPVDPGLKGQYIDEYIGGFEYEVMPNTTAGIRFTHRRLGRVIEDFLVPSSGEYFIANPAEGTLGQSLGFYDGATTTPAPKAERKNNSVELSLRKRFSHNWQFLASYVFSKLEGNYDGTFQNSTGQLDPNINSAFDYADFMVNAQGELTNQHKHQAKLDGSYVLSGGALDGLNFGGSFRWFSGLPLTAYGYSIAYANWEYYLTPRGSLGYGPADYETDVHVGYPLKLGSRAKANIVLDVFNLFNRQSTTVLDQRYNLVSDGACAGVPSSLCNGDGGLIAKPNSVTPAGALANPRATATNPDFLKAGTQFTLPRSARVGVRFTF
jgi:hypothetical protein